MSPGSHLQGNVPAVEQWDTFIALASLIIWKKRRKKIYSCKASHSVEGTSFK